MDPTVLERRAFSGQAECDNVICCRKRNQVRGHLGFVWRLQSNPNIPLCVEEVWIQSPCKGFLLAGTGGCHTASKSRPPDTTERLKRCSRGRPCEPVRVSTTEDEADIMTKVLSAVRHREFCKSDVDVHAVLVASVMSLAVLCRHAGWQSLGAPEAVPSRSRASVQLLTKLVKIETQFAHDGFREMNFLEGIKLEDGPSVF